MASIITRLQTKFEEITGDIFYSDPQQHFGEPKNKITSYHPTKAITFLR